jgi:hypothetical protein
MVGEMGGGVMTCWYIWNDRAAYSACWKIKLVSTTPRADKPLCVSWNPSLASVKGASKKKDMMVMMENRLMLSKAPCKYPRIRRICTQQWVFDPFCWTSHE